MQTLLYPGYQHEPARIDYGIAYTNDAGNPKVDIVALHSKRLGSPHASLIARDESRDRVLNIILSRELAGIRIDRVRFFVMFDSPDLGKTHGWQFPIELDFEDYKREGNPYHIDRPIPVNWLGRIIWALGYRPARCWTRDEDVVGGCARFHTPFEQRRGLDPAEVLKLCEAIDHLALGRTLPKWLREIAVSAEKSA